jgi:hypothetical protein
MIPLDKAREILPSYAFTHAASRRAEQGRTNGNVVLTPGRVKQAHRLKPRLPKAYLLRPSEKPCSEIDHPSRSRWTWARRAVCPTPGPTDAEVAAALATIRLRVQRLLVRRGLAPAADATGLADPLADESPVLAGIVGASVQGRVALGPRAGARVRRLGDARDTATVTSRGARQAHLDGFDLHANVWVSAHDRAALERLCRYVLRPPFAQARLRRRDVGRIALELKRAWHDAAARNQPADLPWRVGPARPMARASGCLWTPWARAHGLDGTAGRRSGRHRGEDRQSARLELGGPDAPGVRHRRVGVCPLWGPPTPDRHAARSRGHPEDPRPRPLGAESRPRPIRIRRRRA